jgi:hypothetical protein
LYGIYRTVGIQGLQAPFGYDEKETASVDLNDLSLEMVTKRPECAECKRTFTFPTGLVLAAGVPEGNKNIWAEC